MAALPAMRGGLLALLAATLFGVSTPLLQRAGEGVGVLSTAALLYAGAAIVGALSRRPAHREARMMRVDLPRLLAIALFGAVIGPVALAWGLQRTSGTSASLMLTLEALFTAVLAWRLYHETMDRRVWTAMALLLAGAIVLVLDQQRGGGTQLWGLLAVAVATAAWGVDNTLSRGLAERDPSQVVMAKGALGAGATALLALGLQRAAAIGGGGARPVRHRCDRLRPEPAFLPARAARLRRRAHRLGLRLRALHRRGAGPAAGRPLGQRLDGRWAAC